MNQRAWVIWSVVASIAMIVSCTSGRAARDRPTIDIDAGKGEPTTLPDAGADAGPDSAVEPASIGGHWRAMSTASSESALGAQAPVWIDGQMLAWGGTWDEPALSGDFKQAVHRTGGLYDPVSDVWTAVAAPDFIEGRTNHGATWSGQEVLIFGGANTDGDAAAITKGARYDPATDKWRGMSTVDAPEPRIAPLLAWMGDQLLVWGGRAMLSVPPKPFQLASLYNPSTDSWTKVDTSFFSLPEGAASVWTGDAVFFWGGRGSDGETVATGGRFDPRTGKFEPLATAGAPPPRSQPVVLSLGNELAVWGGILNNEVTAQGAIYEPVTKRWRVMSERGAPTPRIRPCAVWTGVYLVIWGGQTNEGPLDDGAAYDPQSNSWLKLPQADAPSPRTQPACVWAHDRMIVWSRAQPQVPESGAVLLFDEE